MKSFLEQFSAARAISTPLVTVRTFDNASTIQSVTKSLGKELAALTPLVSWDSINGLVGLNETGREALSQMISDIIVVDHDTKANKVTIKHLDKNGNLLVQQTHDSVGAGRKELTVNGIDHKFYATRSEQRFNDNHDEKTGQFTGAGEQPGKQLDYYSISGSHKEKEWYVTHTTGPRGSATETKVEELGKFKTAKAAGKAAKAHAEQHGSSIDDYAALHASRSFNPEQPRSFAGWIHDATH